MRSRIVFTVFVSLLLTGALAGAAEGPTSSGPMSPATIAPLLISNPAEASPCSGNASRAERAIFATGPESQVIIPQNCGSCGTCTQPRTMCYVFNQGWGTCMITRNYCGDGWQCECAAWGGNP